MSEQSEALLERALVHDEAGDRHLVDDMLMEYARAELHLLREARRLGVGSEREEMRREIIVLTDERDAAAGDSYLRAAVRNYADESIRMLSALKEYV